MACAAVLPSSCVRFGTTVRVPSVFSPIDGCVQVLVMVRAAFGTRPVSILPF